MLIFSGATLPYEIMLLAQTVKRSSAYTGDKILKAACLGMPPEMLLAVPKH